MKEMSAKDAARNFSAMLTAVENGETILVTRSGRSIATIAPAPRGNVRTLRRVFAEWKAAELVDDEFETAIRESLSQVRADEDSDPWSD